MGNGDKTCKGKTILLGVTGCIAAYKSCEILRMLQKAGQDVKVVMTENATKFVGPATFRALTRHPVSVGLFDSPEDPIHHISLAKEADLLLVAPCTANVLVKLAYGIADDLLTTTALATTAPIVVAPAMNTQMWDNPRTVEALEILKSQGVVVVEPDSGYLSCGDSGAGRLAEPGVITEAALSMLHESASLAGKKILITSGPTHEPIDPVRYIGNRSSGLTGLALSQEAARRGAEVVLVSGPTALRDPRGVRTVHVETAQQMLEAAEAEFDSCSAAIFCAAVADFRPEHACGTKIKKSNLDSGESDIEIDGEGGFSLKLVRNADILKTLASRKGDRFVVGFAAETGDVVAYAKEKLSDKNADLIVANDVSDPNLGFGTRDNRVWLVTESDVVDSGLVSKRQVAALVLDRVSEAIC
ncbi:MAG: bifunctional phosphopantothenoylcysteine decarboxylase/phosphopantothenate--cysteine ligase CoaBC [Coriobacteriales bacterium]|jgi:phosphopantothenoylcysteine decarboxylase/phosphopantothenate--cysteine ligase